MLTTRVLRKDCIIFFRNSYLKHKNIYVSIVCVCVYVCMYVCTYVYVCRTLI